MGGKEVLQISIFFFVSMSKPSVFFSSFSLLLLFLFSICFFCRVHVIKQLTNVIYIENDFRIFFLHLFLSYSFRRGVHRDVLNYLSNRWFILQPFFRTLIISILFHRVYCKSHVVCNVFFLVCWKKTGYFFCRSVSESSCIFSKTFWILYAYSSVFSFRISCPLSSSFCCRRVIFKEFSEPCNCFFLPCFLMLAFFFLVHIHFIRRGSWQKCISIVVCVISDK